MKEISLSKNGKNRGKYVATVDDCEYEYLNQYRWYYDGRYAEAHIEGRLIKMHRFILSAEKGTMVDHIDGDKLNNQRCNLRFCTNSQNQMNKKPSGVSRYLGVNWHVTKIKRFRKKTNDYVTITCKGYWRASITIRGKSKHIGLFKVEIDAAIAYDEYAKKHHGEFANLNFPI